MCCAKFITFNEYLTLSPPNRFNPIFYLFIKFTILTSANLSSIPNCGYYNHSWGAPIGYIYYCAPRNLYSITSRSNAVVESIAGNHLSEKTNDDVQGFSTGSKITNYFPKGLEKFFKNLKMISITSGHLKEVHQSDLLVFPDLIAAYLQINDIEVIEEGLFFYNPKLMVVDLSVNKIARIHPQVFDELVELVTLGLISNRCINVQSRNNRYETEKIIDEVKFRCNSNEVLGAVNERVEAEIPKRGEIYENSNSNAFENGFEKNQDNTQNSIRNCSKFSSKTSVLNQICEKVDELERNLTTGIMTSKITDIENKCDLFEGKILLKFQK